VRSQWVEKEGQKVGMRFYGMSSKTAVERYAGGLMDYRASEGRETVVPTEGRQGDARVHRGCMHYDETA
jgi:GMP reductase